MPLTGEAKRAYNRRYYRSHKTATATLRPRSERVRSERLRPEGSRSEGRDQLESVVCKSHTQQKTLAIQTNRKLDLEQAVPPNVFPERREPVSATQPRENRTERPAERPTPLPEKKTNFQVLLEVLGPLAGVPVSAPAPAPAPARHDPPARPQIATPAAPTAQRVRPAQQGRSGGFAPDEGFAIQGKAVTFQ